MKTKKAIETHQAIIDAAKELFMQGPVSKVSVAEIANKAHVAKGTFYLYFETKEDLVWHLLDHELGKANQWFTHFKDFGFSEKEIANMILFLTTFVREHQPILRIVHHMDFTAYLGVEKMLEKYYQSWFNPLKAWLQRGAETGELRIEDPDFTAYFLLTSVHEMMDHIIMGDLKMTLEDFGEKMTSLLIKILK